MRQSSNPTVAKKKILSGYTTSATAVPFSRSRFQVTSVLIDVRRFKIMKGAQHSCAQSLTSAPAVPYSRSRFQVTSVLIEQGILLLPHSRTRALPLSVSEFLLQIGRLGGCGSSFFQSDIQWPGHSAIQSVGSLFRFRTHHLSLSSSVRYQLNQPFTKPRTVD